MLSKKFKTLLLVLLTGSNGLPLSSCAYQENIESSSTSSESSDSMDDSSMEDTSSSEDTSSISSSNGIDYEALFPGTIKYATNSGVFNYNIINTTEAEVVGYVATSATDGAGIVNIPASFINGSNTYTTTSIGVEAFKYASLDNVAIYTITIPDSVTSIKLRAFYGLYDVTTITIGTSSNLSFIDRSAFAYCLSLTDIYIPSGVKEIPTSCFFHCESLGETTKEYYYYDETSSSVKHSTYTSGTDYTVGVSYATTPYLYIIGMSAFGYCYGLTTFTCPSSLRIIKARAFIGCENLETMVLNYGLVKMDAEIFMYCSLLNSINLNNESSSEAGDATLEMIGANVFDYCYSTNTDGYVVYNSMISLYKAVDASSVDNTIDASGTASDETTTPVIGYIDGWAVFCTNFAYNNTVKFFKFIDSTWGIASDVLQLVPNVTSNSYSGTTGPISMSLPYNLMYISNNFFRQSGDSGFTGSHPTGYSGTYMGTKIVFRNLDGTTVASTVGTSRFKVITVTDSQYYSNSSGASQTSQLFLQMYYGYTFREINGVSGDYYENQVKCLAAGQQVVWKYQSSFSAITFSSHTPSSITKLTQLAPQCAYACYYFFKQFGTSTYSSQVGMAYDLVNYTTGATTMSGLSYTPYFDVGLSMYNYVARTSTGASKAVANTFGGVARLNDEIQAVFDFAFEGNNSATTYTIRKTYIYPSNIQFLGRDICASNILSSKNTTYYHFTPGNPSGILRCWDRLFAAITIGSDQDTDTSDYWFSYPYLFWNVTIDYSTYAGAADWVTK